MSRFSKMLMKPLAAVTGNFVMQKVLKKLVDKSQYLMGIGAGTDVYSSGEHAIFRILKKNAKEPFVIFDVGANIGQFLGLTQSCLKSNNYHVHCFEPGKTTFGQLTNNVESNSNISLNNFGLGKEKGEFELFYDNPGSGLASLTQRKLDYHNIDFSQSETVKIETLDAYCQENSIDEIDLLKIDTEGHEFDVLSGAAAMFEKKAIKVVTIEFGGSNIDTGTYFRNFYEFFTENGMSIYRITPSGYLSPIKKYNEREEQFITINYLAVRN